MRITITGIQFIYDDGYENEYTGIEVNHIETGIPINFNEPVTLTKQQYEDNKSDKNGLKVIVAEKITEKLNELISEVTAYKESLEPEPEAE